MTCQPEKQELARQLCRAGRSLFRQGFTPANGGNLSVRCPDGHILITPSGVSKGELRPGMILELDEHGTPQYGGAVPSVEAPLHLAVLGGQPDLHCVIHAHPPHGVAMSLLGQDLVQPVITDACLLGIIPVLPYAPIGSPELAAQTGAAAARYNGALLARHGACTWGRSIQEALFLMEMLEHVCRQLCLMWMMGHAGALGREESDQLIQMRRRSGRWRGGEHMPPLDGEV